MNESDRDRRMHWETAYASKAFNKMSWYQAAPRASLELIEKTGAPKEASMIDVGGGASTLTDHLIEKKYSALTVLDISPTGIDAAKHRLGSERSALVDWVIADVTTWSPCRAFDIWHDRAVLHFLTTSPEQAAYRKTLRAALNAGGWAIIGGFAPGGPTHCSGLDIVQHDAESLNSLFGPEYHLHKVQAEMHHTPTGGEQPFLFHVFRFEPAK